eukprot:CAMPEP_0113318104 /NCGR_PEP_ID=MMETSP0010_2-20120614/12788_1 /TAXON_ID=216773 ORGANISM="Corethron hystrix, Strain 308" /NCGR_SAMPLE_ID=MMETSP0010_2 /ASSEMBLY_ACC=CAM_ASM_000155 /LENGTH=105 /DNA_ID=CAMNT_0000175303 /DNA_START=537 /DNA_END=854 /DNA_ORIENTATION=- /assembly_acc=CAM_ASM_000155
MCRIRGGYATPWVFPAAGHDSQWLPRPPAAAIGRRTFGVEVVGEQSLSFERPKYVGTIGGELPVGHGVGFGDDGDDADFLLNLAQEVAIDLEESSGTQKVEADVD